MLGVLSAPQQQEQRAVSHAATPRVLGFFPTAIDQVQGQLSPAKPRRHRRCHGWLALCHP